jgi:hypothetical protein
MRLFIVKNEPNLEVFILFLLHFKPGGSPFESLIRAQARIMTHTPLLEMHVKSNTSHKKLRKISGRGTSARAPAATKWGPEWLQKS